jgi:hypothetical protein
MTFLNKIFTKPDPDDVSTDVGGRSRVSIPVSIGNYKNIYGSALAGLVSSNAGTGTITYTTDSELQLSVTSGQYHVVQTKEYHYYVAGATQKIDITFNNFGVQANVTKRIGYFSSSASAPYNTVLDGISIFNDGTTIIFQVHRAGTLVIDSPITSWINYSRYNLASINWNNFCFLTIDFLWQGGKTIRLSGQLSDGRYVLFHKVDYAQNFELPFAKSPYQPLRAEIRSTTGTGSMRFICGSVSRDDGGDAEVRRRSVNTGGTTFGVGAIGTRYVLAALRKNVLYRDAYASIVGAGVVLTTSDTLLVELVKNATLNAGTLTYSAISNSSLQFAAGNGTQTIAAANGTILESAYLNNTTPLNFNEKNLLSNLYGDINDVMDTIFLVGTPVTSTMNLAASLTYEELL